MAQVQRKQVDSDENAASPLKSVLAFALICAVVFFAYKIFWKDGQLENSIPRAMQVTFVPADFRVNLDEQKTLEILSNPQRFQREFDALILGFNTQLVVHVANRMGLNGNLRSGAVAEYNKMHPYIRQMYYNDFISLRDTTSQLYRTWYENESASAVDLLNEVASKYTCFFVTNIMATVLKTQDGKLAVRGNKVETPCGIALTEGLRPMVKRLQDAAAIRDFSKAKGLMRERVERAITELAVVEVTDKKGIRVHNATRVMGMNVSATDVEITAMSVAKIGYVLNKSFEISVDEGQKRVIVTLPQPQILSHEVFPKVENLDVGWLREVNQEDFNQSINALRQAFRDDIFKSAAFENAQQRAKSVLDLILSPVVKSIGKNYTVALRFQQPMTNKG
jgi:hypothetical protein